MHERRGSTPQPPGQRRRETRRERIEIVSEQKRDDKESRTDAKGIDTRYTPAQPAEGGRAAVEQDLREKSGGDEPAEKPAETGGQFLSTPSQAEGNRGTVEQDLDEKFDDDGKRKG